VTVSASNDSNARRHVYADSPAAPSEFHATGNHAARPPDDRAVDQKLRQRLGVKRGDITYGP